jgi:hypothetical protein
MSTLPTMVSSNVSARPSNEVSFAPATFAPVASQTFSRFAAPIATVRTQSVPQDRDLMASLTQQFSQLPLTFGETVESRVQQYLDLAAVLPEKHRAQLLRLLKNGTLTNRSDYNKHSTLYHLHQRLTQPCIPGMDRVQLIGLMLNLLERPYTVTQKPGRVSAAFCKAIQDVSDRPEAYGRVRKVAYTHRPITRQDIDTSISFDCTAAALMFGMLDHQRSRCPTLTPAQEPH